MKAISPLENKTMMKQRDDSKDSIKERSENLVFLLGYNKKKM